MGKIREKELGKVMVTTAGDGLWSNVQRAVVVTIWITLDEDSIWRDPDGTVCANCSCQAMFDPADWDVERDGLMYTDCSVEAQVNQYLRSLGYTHGVVWSEQGAQLVDGADFDADWGLALEVWPELRSRTWPDERTIN